MKNEFIFTTIFQYFKNNELKKEFYHKTKVKKENIKKMENGILNSNLNIYDKVCIGWTANPNINSIKELIS